MASLYETLEALCAERGIRGGRMCTDLGLSKSLMTDLKSGRKKNVSAVTAQKLAAYFGVSVGYLLGEEEKSAPVPQNRGISDEDIKFALFGGDGEITDAMYDEVRSFAAYVKQREALKKKE